MPSTARPQELPGVEKLRRLAKSIAMLDAIICPEWEYRYYSYNSKWGQGEEMASMRNGCGDDWFLLFGPYGAALKGFAHEFPQAEDPSFPSRIQETVPATFESFLKEPAFSMERATFCLWSRPIDAHWSVVAPANGSTSPEKDGSAELLGIFDRDPRTYQLWAVDYYERDFPLIAVQSVYEHRPLTNDLVKALNAEIVPSDLTSDALEIGYPSKAPAV